MKSKILISLISLGLLSSSCDEKDAETSNKSLKTEPSLYLPFQSIALTDLSGFEKTSENWKVSGAAYVDRSQEKMISTTEGSNVLVNIPKKDIKENLFTIFKHGDIEFECEVMMPVNSNSGIYFQSRYEIQLFDSWGVDVPKHGDMGGIYQRWNENAEEEKKGFEGYAPMVNAAKAPGLWQHLKVIFHAPKFDSSGNKIKNAQFEEVWLNGALIHQNVEVSGPTRGGINTEEVAIAPLMIQGNHGPIALRNIKYKLYDNKKVELSDVRLKEYENASVLFPHLDSLVVIRDVQTDSISATMATGVRPQKLLNYTGKLKIPEDGDYMFDYKLNRAGGTFLIDNDTVISMNGNYNLDSLGIAKIALKKGAVPFQLIYNKHVPWQIGFGLYVEGPGIQKHALHSTSSLNLPNEAINPDFMIEINDEPITQRGFWMHEGEKRTHCIAVGNPKGIHYVYDLELGSLLQVWNGGFMDASKMWEGRGEKQLGRPAGFMVSLHGDGEFTSLVDEKKLWPKDIPAPGYKSLGYEFDTDGFPIFSYQVDGGSIANKFVPASKNRGLKRYTTVRTSNDGWFKIADGSKIEKLPDGTFMVNNENYFIDFQNNDLQLNIRKSGNNDELLIKIPSGEHQVEYTIIW